jgi:hypothetical protein
MSGRRIFTRPARLAALAPYLWMVLFFLVPFGFVLKIAMSQTASRSRLMCRCSIWPQAGRNFPLRWEACRLRTSSC